LATETASLPLENLFKTHCFKGHFPGKLALLSARLTNE